MISQLAIQSLVTLHGYMICPGPIRPAQSYLFSSTVQYVQLYKVSAVKLVQLQQSILGCVGEEYESGEEEEEMEQPDQVAEAPDPVNIVEESGNQLQARMLQSGSVAMATASHSGIGAMENGQLSSSNMVNQNVSVLRVTFSTVNECKSQHY